MRKEPKRYVEVLLKICCGMKKPFKILCIDGGGIKAFTLLKF